VKRPGNAEEILGERLGEILKMLKKAGYELEDIIILMHPPRSYPRILQVVQKDENKENNNEAEEKSQYFLYPQWK